MNFGTGIKVHNSLFAAFTENHTFPFLKVNVITVEQHKLTDTHTCGSKNIYL